jgi:hypothetical protein
MLTEWIDFEDQSVLPLKLGADPAIWRSDDMPKAMQHRWHSNTPPLSGSWESREEAKAAIVAALRRQYTEFLERLPMSDVPVIA